MNQELGSKGGKNDRIIYLKNKKRKKKKLEEELINYRKRVRKKNIVLNDNKITQKTKSNDTKTTDQKQENKVIPKNKIIVEKTYNKKSSKAIQKDISKKNIHIDDSKKEEIILPKTNNKNEFISKSSNHDNKDKENKSIIKNDGNTEKKNIKNNEHNKLSTIKPNIKLNKTPKKEEKTNNDISLIEEQILIILDQKLDDNKFELKKIDSELYSIKKNMEETKDLKELETLENEIDILIEKLNYIKKQIESILRTVDYKIPIEIPDNYLIYLVDEYKNNRKQQIDLYEKIENHKEFKSVIDKIIQIENDKEQILEKLTEKKNDYNIQDEQVKKINDEIINLDDINIEIKKMIEKQQNTLKEIETKVAETVHITEKVNYISEYTKHSIFELFILMNMLKRNLSLKSNAVNAVSTALILNQIMKLTTPKVEKQTSLINDLQNYEHLISACIQDTNKLLEIIHGNLTQISSIRYTFLNNYKECNYLDSYKEVINKLDELENSVKEKEKEVIRIKKETEYQLEKNNAKVKKYEKISV